MKLTPLTASTFEAMSKDAMRYIVGGEACATPGGTKTHVDGTTYKFSADTQESKTSITYHRDTDKSTAACQCPTTVPSTAK
jgi:hypothetical protein